MRTRLFALIATLMAFAIPATAQDTANWSGLSFSLEGGSGGDGGYGAVSAAYMFPIGNGSLMIGPVVGISGYSLRHTETPTKTGKIATVAQAGKVQTVSTSVILDRVKGNKTTSFDAGASLGIRLASVFKSNRGLVFAEVGAERYKVSETQEYMSFNRLVSNTSTSSDVGGYAAIGAEFCASSGCNMTYTGQIRYHDVTKDTSVQVGLGLRF